MHSLICYSVMPPHRIYHNKTSVTTGLGILYPIGAHNHPHFHCLMRFVLRSSCRVFTLFQCFLVGFFFCHVFFDICFPYCTFSALCIIFDYKRILKFRDDFWKKCQIQSVANKEKSARGHTGTKNTVNKKKNLRIWPLLFYKSISINVREARSFGTANQTSYI